MVSKSGPSPPLFSSPTVRHPSIQLTIVRPKVQRDEAALWLSLFCGSVSRRRGDAMPCSRTDHREPPLLPLSRSDADDPPDAMSSPELTPAPRLSVALHPTLLCSCSQLSQLSTTTLHPPAPWLAVVLPAADPGPATHQPPTTAPLPLAHGNAWKSLSSSSADDQCCRSPVRSMCVCRDVLPLCSSPAPSRSYSSQTSTATRSNPTSANKPLAHPPAAASSAPHPAPHAAPQQHAPMQQQQSGGGGMLSGLAGTVMSGMAFGTGRTNNSDPRAGRVCNAHARLCSSKMLPISASHREPLAWASFFFFFGSRARFLMLSYR